MITLYGYVPNAVGGMYEDIIRLIDQTFILIIFILTILILRT